MVHNNSEIQVTPTLPVIFKHTKLLFAFLHFLILLLLVLIHPCAPICNELSSVSAEDGRHKHH